LYECGAVRPVEELDDGEWNILGMDCKTCERKEYQGDGSPLHTRQQTQICRKHPTLRHKFPEVKANATDSPTQVFRIILTVSAKSSLPKWE
jgi:hypothetical protein